MIWVPKVSVYVMIATVMGVFLLFFFSLSGAGTTAAALTGAIFTNTYIKTAADHSYTHILHVIRITGVNASLNHHQVHKENKLSLMNYETLNELRLDQSLKTIFYYYFCEHMKN